MKRCVTVVVGGQFGSEAKGKVISFLANEFDIAVRTGSPNAGHTVIHDGKIYKLRCIPSTFVNPNCVLYLGVGARINLGVLIKEIKETQTESRLFVDPQATIIEKRHILQERSSVKSISSTGQGGGAAYKERVLGVLGKSKLAKDVLGDFCLCNTIEMINKGIGEGKKVLIEGTQGYGLSLYYDYFPFVTSRDTTAAAFVNEVGISPLLVKEIILVIRTFPIRVAGNSGPLPNEISWKELSRRTGKEVREFTTVTGKLRRVAEFDINIVKEAIMANRPTQIALQFLNYLYPEDENKNTWRSLSKVAKKYIKDLEAKLEVPITLIGSGRANESMIDRRKTKKT